MAQDPTRALGDKELSGEYLEKGAESQSRYRDFDNFSKSKQEILTLIADRIRAEAASAEYKKIAAQTVERKKTKGSARPASVNFRA